MKLEEAIANLRKDIDDPGSIAIEDVNKAEEIGIEALKRIEDLRVNKVFRAGILLPGETEE